MINYKHVSISLFCNHSLPQNVDEHLHVLVYMLVTHYHHGLGYLNPVNSSDGKVLLILVTAHEGITFRRPFPRWCHIHLVNRL